MSTIQERVMINPKDVAMLLIDHQSGLFNLVKDIPVLDTWGIHTSIPVENNSASGTAGVSRIIEFKRSRRTRLRPTV